MEFRRSNKILRDWKKLIQSTDFTLGKYMVEFEKKFAKYIGAKSRTTLVSPKLYVLKLRTLSTLVYSAEPHLDVLECSPSWTPLRASSARPARFV